MIACILFCVVALTAEPSLGAATDVPDAPTLLDRSDAAAGPVPKSFHETIEFSGTADAGKRVIFARGADRREVVDEGPLHTESGIDGGVRWHENPNGHVVIDEDDPGLATPETFTTTVKRLSQPADAYVILKLNAKGFGTRRYFDPTTYHLVRQESLTPTGTITTVYDDFRSFGARHLAARWSVHDQTTATDTQFVVREYVAADVSPTEIARPQIKSPIVEYPAGSDRVVLPSTFERSGHIVVRLSINGRGLDYILDTGSSTNTLDPGVAAGLGLTIINKRQSTANAGRFATGEAIVPLIKIGELQMRNTVVTVAPWTGQEGDVKTVGLLGFDFICESGITIDYENHTVTAQRYGTYAPPNVAGTIALEVRLGNQIPITTANINGAIAERIGVDTGAVGPFLLFDYFARRHPQALPHSAFAGSMTFRGAGGQFEARRVVLDSLELGTITFERFAGYVVASQTSYSGNGDGVIGPGFLHYFDVHLDYPNGMIYLVPNATGKRSEH